MKAETPDRVHRVGVTEPIAAARRGLASEAPPWTANSRRRDTVARALLVVAATGAALAALGAAGSVAGADEATRVVETWRLLGFGVFAGLFALLAWKPRRYAGVWELVIANKLALAGLGLAYGSETQDAMVLVVGDGVLAALLLTAYVLSRGWSAWGGVARASGAPRTAHGEPLDERRSEE